MNTFKIKELGSRYLFTLLYLKKNIVYPHEGNSYHKNDGKK